MRIKQEHSTTSDYEMRKIFNKYYNQYNDLFWKKSGENPTLNQVRGKVVILSDIYSLNDYGINYRNISVQDEYHLNTNWDLYSKWQKIKNFALEVNNRTSKLNINYLSGSGASTTRLSFGISIPAFIISIKRLPAISSPIGCIVFS